MARRMFHGGGAEPPCCSGPMPSWRSSTWRGQRRNHDVAATWTTNIVPGPRMSVHAVEQEESASTPLRPRQDRSLCAGSSDHRNIRELARISRWKRAATLEDVAPKCSPRNRLKVAVFGGFAAVASTIAVVGVAGVVAFSVSARSRFGMRASAIGSAPQRLLVHVLGGGATIAGAGIVAGAVFAWLASIVSRYVSDVRTPGAPANRGRRRSFWSRRRSWHR